MMVWHSSWGCVCCFHQPPFASSLMVNDRPYNELSLQFGITGVLEVLEEDWPRLNAADCRSALSSAASRTRAHHASASPVRIAPVNLCLHVWHSHHARLPRCPRKGRDRGLQR